MWVLTKAVYAELVAVLRTKVRWPPPPSGWTKEVRVLSWPERTKGRNSWGLQIRSRDSRCMIVSVWSWAMPVTDDVYA
jgi:hypothetical protein